MLGLMIKFLNLHNTNFLSKLQAENGMMIAAASQNGVGNMGSPVPTINQGTINVGFNIPPITVVIGFIIKFFFIIAGLVSLLYLLLGALAWITSGGDKESIGKAREKIQAAVIGLILIFIVLTIVVLLENILDLGLGISKEIIFPKLIN